jgi:hypothetical protein
MRRSGNPLTPRERLASRFARAWKRGIAIDVEKARREGEHEQDRVGQIRPIMMGVVIIAAVVLFMLWLVYF